MVAATISDLSSFFSKVMIVLFLFSFTLMICFVQILDCLNA